MSVLKCAGSLLVGLAGKAKVLFDEKNEDGMDGYELAGVDVPGNRMPFGGFEPLPVHRVAAKSSRGAFDFGIVLRLRSFLYLLAATVLFLLQIGNTLAINDLAGRNEHLREELRISTSIRTAQELQVRQMQSIRNITGPAEKLGLVSLPVPPVEIEP